MSRSAPNEVAHARHSPSERRRAARAALRPRALRPSLRVPRRLSAGTCVVAAAALAALLASILPFALSSAPPVAATAAAADEDVPDEPPGLAPAAPVVQAGPGTPRGDSQRIELVVDGLDRSYFLLPALGLPPDEEAALLVVLHQDVSSGREISVDLGLDTLRRHGVTLAYPNGYGGSWNSGACCGIAAERDIDDVGFVNTVIEDVARHTPIDPSRRALLGYSGGGMLAYRLLCAPHPELVAAVEVNGSLEAECADGLALPDLLSVHGEKDGSIGITTSRFVNHLKMAPRSVTSTLTAVTGHAGCGPRTTSAADGVALWRWTGCRGGGSVEAQIVPDAGHGWADVGGAERALPWLLPRLTTAR